MGNGEGGGLVHACERLLHWLGQARLNLREGKTDAATAALCRAMVAADDAREHLELVIDTAIQINTVLGQLRDKSSSSTSTSGRNPGTGGERPSTGGLTPARPPVDGRGENQGRTRGQAGDESDDGA